MQYSESSFPPFGKCIPRKSHHSHLLFLIISIYPVISCKRYAVSAVIKRTSGFFILHATPYFCTACARAPNSLIPSFFNGIRIHTCGKPCPKTDATAQTLHCPKSSSAFPINSLFTLYPFFQPHIQKQIGIALFVRPAPRISFKSDVNIKSDGLRILFVYRHLIREKNFLSHGYEFFLYIMPAISERNEQHFYLSVFEREGGGVFRFRNREIFHVPQCLRDIFFYVFTLLFTQKIVSPLK